MCSTGARRPARLCWHFDDFLRQDLKLFSDCLRSSGHRRLGIRVASPRIEFSVMRTPKLAAAGIAVLTASLLLAGHAEAQSFIQKVFGFGAPAAPAPSYGGPQTRTIPASRLYGRAPRRLYHSRPANDGSEDDVIGPPDNGGPYRTLCVRTCDGFYFPMRHNAVRKNFSSDVKSCRAACGSEARLFYYPVNSGSTDTMQDLAGGKYAELPHAFAYRKALVSGCSCKPVPWSQEAVTRHDQYAADEAVELAKDQAFLVTRAAHQAKSAIVAITAPEASAVASSTAASSESSESELQVVDTVANSAAVVPARPVTRKRSLRSQRAGVQRAQYKPTSWSPFSGGKSKYTWPGDAR